MSNAERKPLGTTPWYDPKTESILMATRDQAARLKAGGYAVGDDAAKAYASSGIAGATLSALLGAAHGASMGMSDLVMDKVAPSAKPMLRALEEAHPYIYGGAEIGGGAAAMYATGGAAGAVGMNARAARILVGTIGGATSVAAEASRNDHPLTGEQLAQGLGFGFLMAAGGEGADKVLSRMIPKSQAAYGKVLDNLVERGWFRKQVPRGISRKGPVPFKPTGTASEAGAAAGGFTPAAAEAVDSGMSAAASTMGARYSARGVRGAAPAAAQSAAQAAPKAGAAAFSKANAGRGDGTFAKLGQEAEEVAAESLQGKVDLSDLPPPYKSSSSMQPPPGYQVKGPYPEGHVYHGYETDVNYWPRNKGPGFVRDGTVPSWHETEAGQQWAQNNKHYGKRVDPRNLKDGASFSDTLPPDGVMPPGSPVPSAGGGQGAFEGPELGANVGSAYGAMPPPPSVTPTTPPINPFTGGNAAGAGVGAGAFQAAPPKFVRGNNPLNTWGRIAHDVGNVSLGAQFIPGVKHKALGWLTGGAYTTSRVLWGLGSFMQGSLNNSQNRQRIINKFIQPSMVGLGKVVRQVMQDPISAEIDVGYSHADIDKAYQATTKPLDRLLADPSVVSSIAERKLGPLTEDAPTLHQNIVNTQLAGLKYLHDQRPKDPRTPGLVNDPYDPPRAEKVRYLKTFRAVNDPIGTLKDPTVEDIKAIEATHPETLKNLRTQIVSGLLDKQRSYTRHEAKRISIVMGTPINSRMDPGYIARLQKLAVGQSPGVQSVKRPPGRPPKQKIQVNRQSANSIAPGSQQNEVENTQ